MPKPKEDKNGKNGKVLSPEDVKAIIFAGLPTGDEEKNDQAQAAILRSKIELIRRADEVRQAKSEALMKFLASVPIDDGSPKIPSSMKAMYEAMTAEHDVALEQWLNGYEDACAEFLVGAVARKYFEVSLSQEIRELVENDGPQQTRLKPRNSSPYKAIHAVYDALFTSEAGK